MLGRRTVCLSVVLLTNFVMGASAMEKLWLVHDCFVHLSLMVLKTMFLLSSDKVDVKDTVCHLKNL